MDDCCRVSMEPLVRHMEQHGQSVLLPRALPWGTGNDILVSTKDNDFFSYAIYHLLCNNKWYYIPYTTVLMSTGTIYLSERRKEYKRMFPKFQFKLLGVDERANKYLFREGGSTWHQIDGDIIFHIYSHLRVYSILGCILFALFLYSCWHRERSWFRYWKFRSRIPSHKLWSAWVCVVVFTFNRPGGILVCFDELIQVDFRVVWTIGTYRYGAVALSLTNSRQPKILQLLSVEYLLMQLIAQILTCSSNILYCVTLKLYTELVYHQKSLNWHNFYWFNTGGTRQHA